MSAEDDSLVDTWYRVTEGTLSDPQWDRTGQLWVLDHTSEGTDWVVADGDEAAAVPAGRARPLRRHRDGDLAPTAPASPRWSTAGTARSGVGAGSTGNPWSSAGSCERPTGSPCGRLDHAYAIQTRGAEFTGLLRHRLGRADAGDRAGRRRRRCRRSRYQLALDGSSVLGATVSGEALLPEVGARTLAAVGISDAPTVVGDAGGNLSVLGTDEPWSVVADGLRRPHYPS